MREGVCLELACFERSTTLGMLMSDACCIHRTHRVLDLGQPVRPDTRLHAYALVAYRHFLLYGVMQVLGECKRFERHSQHMCVRRICAVEVLCVYA